MNNKECEQQRIIKVCEYQRNIKVYVNDLKELTEKQYNNKKLTVYELELIERYSNCIMNVSKKLNELI